MKRLLPAACSPNGPASRSRPGSHVSLAELRALDDGSALESEWITAVRVRWAAHRAAASEGARRRRRLARRAAAQATSCDATLTPVVTGDTDLSVLDDLVSLCVELDRLDHRADPPQTSTPTDPQTLRSWPLRPALTSREALQQAIIGKGADLLSGPGGLASFLRTRLLGARLAAPACPWTSATPRPSRPAIRNAVILRDRRCRWPGGCNQPASACEVHHVKHKANGGHTSTKDCVLLCSYHHQVVHPPLGLEPGPEPRRHHHRLEPGPHQGPAQPQTPSTRRVTSPGGILTATPRRGRHRDF